MFQGSMVALVTPFKKGRVDKLALKKLVDFQIANGTDAIIPCGTTGEAATLSHEEHKMVLSFVVNHVAGRVPVICGAGSNNTKEALELTKYAKSIKADGVLLVSPYYNKPTQEGLYRHYSEIANAVSVPIVLYNVPSRTGSSIEPDTVARLAKISNIVAIKEASGSLEQVTKILTLVPRFTVISGDDALTMPMMAIGAKGVISVLANIVPDRMSQMVHAVLNGDYKLARKMHYNLYSLSKAMFIETNPIPVKAALHLMGKISNEIRLPLTPLPKEKARMLEKILKLYNVK
ncbi:MAG: 4-hydroxy-tetrahydrodipicolinate synthase [Candidatus Omnitrophica bacterium]|nr:4-hydroxy-tetrahydrodipicolinate synthase [Candidatus Omnitrophota bacterium]